MMLLPFGLVYSPFFACLCNMFVFEQGAYDVSSYQKR